MAPDNHESKTVRQAKLTEFGIETGEPGRIVWDKYRQILTKVK